MTTTPQLPAVPRGVGGQRPAGAAPGPARPPTPLDLDVVVPVHNEERGLPGSLRRLHTYLRDTMPFSWRVTVADNASTDATLAVARELAAELPGVRVVHLSQKGRGAALRQAWSASEARVLAYMDVDLSTDLDALLPLVAPLLTGHSDLAIGSRLARGARVRRGPRREVLSRGYNALLRLVLRARFSDAQCGFKAVRAQTARDLLPLVRDESWFFDTELLVLAERAGLRISEVPVDWVDDPDSRVDVAATVRDDLRGVARLARGIVRGSLPLAQVRRPEAVEAVEAALWRQLVRFAGVGAATTLLHAVLFVALRLVFGAQAANAAALVLATLANTAANRRLTFGVRGRAGALRSQLQGLALLVAGLALTSGSLAALAALAPDAGRASEVGAIVAANLVVTLAKFLLFRAWVFPARHSSGGAR